MQNKNNLIKLLLWIVFFLIIIIISKLPSKKNNVTENINTEVKIETNDETIYENIKSVMQKYNYEFEFNIQNNNETIIYSGKRIQEEIQGYKEDTTGIQKFYINEDKVYSYNGTSKEYLSTLSEITTDYTLMDPSSLFVVLDTIDYYEDVDNLIFKNDIYDIQMSKMENDTLKIKIINGDIVYNLKYYNINKVNEL